MRVLISQPMKGKSREQVIAERTHAIDVFRACGYDVVESVLTEYAKTHSALSCLSVSLELLTTVDLVFFMAGWEDARGCSIEHTCCIKYGIPVVYSLENFEHKLRVDAALTAAQNVGKEV